VSRWQFWRIFLAWLARHLAQTLRKVLAVRRGCKAVGFGIMTDPQFQTRAALESWAKDMSGTVVTAVTLAKTGEPEHARSIWQSALAQLRRVTIAHLHLPFEEEPKK
jgi:fumarate hydratase class II